MGINYSIDSEARIVRLDYVGLTGYEELAATMTAIFRSPSYRPGFGFLADRRAVEAPTRDYVERVVGFMSMHREKLVGGRYALVVSSPAGYGMARMGQMLAEHTRDPIAFQVFDDIGEAERWLREATPHS